MDRTFCGHKGSIQETSIVQISMSVKSKQEESQANGNEAEAAAQPTFFCLEVRAEYLVTDGPPTPGPPLVSHSLCWLQIDPPS